VNVRELRRLADKNSSDTIHLYNPVSVPFSWTFEGVKYDIPSPEQEVISVPRTVGLKLKKHLVDFVLNTKGKDPLLNREDVEKEVEIIL